MVIHLAINNKRNEYGLTLPFALILTFIFSGLVGVSYLLVSVNLSQMQSNQNTMAAIAISEGINERIKARLNTKQKIKPSPKQEEKLKSSESEDEGFEEFGEEDFEDEFSEVTEDFDEYYADEILKILRYITFREPPEEIETTSEEQERPQTPLEQAEESPALRPEANISMVGDIDIPQGTVLNPGTMVVVYKDKKINLKLKDIVQDQKTPYKAKLPIPKITALSPNYSEGNKRSEFLVAGENFSYNHQPRFSNKNIVIEDVKAGPTVEFLIGMDVMAGLNNFYWENARGEFYIIPSFDGSLRPAIYEVTTNDNKQFLEIKAGQRNIYLTVSGDELYLKKGLPVVVPDVCGIIPKLKDQLSNGKQLLISLSIDRNVEPGVHSLVVATEGGLSNTWIFNVIAPDEDHIEITNNTAVVTSSLTLLGLRVVENLLPIIDEEEELEEKKEEEKKEEPEEELVEQEEEEEEDLTEKEKLSPFANIDLETTWLLETSAMVGKITRTVSEVVQRQIPNIQSAVTTNGEISFDGGSYQILGATTAMTTLTEPTYISNTNLVVEGPPEEPSEPIDTNTGTETTPPLPKSPAEVGFTPGSLVAVYKESDRLSELDYAVVSNIGRNTIELVPPGLKDFHYEGDQVFQFVPPIISKEKIEGTEAEKHIIPKDFALGIPQSANARNLFRTNIEQYAELADLYTSDGTIPRDENDIPVGYMLLTYVDGTPTYDENNVLAGKGILIIDTRADNQGRPIGDVEIRGDSRSPVDFNGIIYVKGNLRIDGNVSINGALIVDNEDRGKIQISSNALGRIAYDARAIQQSILYTPFTTKPGTVMISNKVIDLKGYVESAFHGSHRRFIMP